MPITSDEVAVFDNSFNQVFYGAHILKATIKETSKPMEHPVEDGSTITDFRIINPIEIELSIICDPDTYKNVYNEIRKQFLLGTSLVCQTKTGTYRNMIIQTLPQDQSPDIASTVSIALSLKEVKIVEAQYESLPPKSVKNKKDASTSDQGEKQPTEDNTASTSSALHDWFN